MFTIHNSWITNNYDKESLPEIYQYYIQLYNWIQSSYYAKFRIKVYPETACKSCISHQHLIQFSGPYSRAYSISVPDLLAKREKK